MTSRFDHFVTELQGLAPFRIRYKDESWEMQLMYAFVFWFCPGFLDAYTTIIGSTIYFPSRLYIEQNEEEAMRTLAHEMVHLLDAEQLSEPVFMAGYLFPQVLALGVFSFPLIGLWSLLFLLFLLPFPAPGRFYFESRAYAIDMLTTPLPFRQRRMEHILDQFESWNYYLMFPFRAFSRRIIQHWMHKAERGEDTKLLKVLLLYEMVIDG